MAEFTKDYVNMFKNWSDFSGKTKRGEFWMAILVHVIVNLVLQALGQVAGIFGTIGMIYSLVVLIPMIAIGIRRFHDIGKSGWNWLWWLLPIIGWIIAVVLWAKE